MSDCAQVEIDKLKLKIEKLEELACAMRNELETIERAIDDPRLDLTMSAVEIIAEYKQRLTK